MVIKTKDFGFVEIDERDVLNFPNGVYAFENVKKFVILKHNDGDPVMQLQAVESENPRFIIADPFLIVPGYDPKISEEEKAVLQADSEKDLNYFVITVIPQNIRDATANLKSPVVVNFKKKLGMQVILENDSYPIRYPLFNDEGMDE